MTISLIADLTIRIKIKQLTKKAIMTTSNSFRKPKKSMRRKTGKTTNKIQYTQYYHCYDCGLNQMSIKPIICTTH